MLTELIDTLHHFARLSEEAEVLSFAFEGFAVSTFELGFVIEGFEMTDAAAAKDLNDPLGLWCEVGEAR